MNNKLSSLDDHLFGALDRLADQTMTPEQIESEVKRADAIVAVADQLIENSKIKLGAARLFADHGDRLLPYLPQIGKTAPTKTIKGEAE